MLSVNHKFLYYYSLRNRIKTISIQSEMKKKMKEIIRYIIVGEDVEKFHFPKYLKNTDITLMDFLFKILSIGVSTIFAYL